MHEINNTGSTVLIRPSLHNTYYNSCNYYNFSTKQHVSALFGHQAYKTVMLVKAHSVALTYGIPRFETVLSIFFELQVMFKNNYHTILFLNFRRVLNVICSFLGNSPASEF